MSEHGERVGVVTVLRRQDLDLLPIGQGKAQVAQVAVHAHADRLLGEPGPDRARSDQPACPVGQLEQ